MNLPALILSILGLIAAAGVVAAYFARSRGKETIDLLQTNIEAYKDSEKLKDTKILVLENRIMSLNDVIDVRDKTIERLVNGKK